MKLKINKEDWVYIILEEKRSKNEYIIKGYSLRLWIYSKYYKLRNKILNFLFFKFRIGKGYKI